MLAGQRLRALREQLNLTMRDVEITSSRIAAKRCNDEFTVAPSRLSDIETKGVTPSIYRLYSLAVTYHRDVRELMGWYGVDVNDVPRHLEASQPPVTHLTTAVLAVEAARIPVRLDPSFDPRCTVNLGRVVEQWGIVPIMHLAQFAEQDFTYAYVGTEDLTMYPLVLPGAFLQVDESRHKVQAGMWRSEYERPIYFVETRDRFFCSWCSVEGDRLTVQPHPLSPQSSRSYKYPQEAEVLGQVVGIAMRLVDWRSPSSQPTRLARP